MVVSLLGAATAFLIAGGLLWVLLLTIRAPSRIDRFLFFATPNRKYPTWVINGGRVLTRAWLLMLAFVLIMIGLGQILRP